VYEIELRKKMEARQGDESSKMKIRMGSQIRNYVMHPYNWRKTVGVRTVRTPGNVDAVMDGHYPTFLKAYLMMMDQKEPKVRKILRALEQKLKLFIGTLAGEFHTFLI